MTGGTKFHADSTTAMLTCEHQGPIRATQTLDSAGKATNYAEVDSSTSFNLALRQQFTDSFSLYLNVENLADKDDMVLIQASDAKNKTGLLIDPIYYLNGRKFTLGAEVEF